MHRDVLRQGTRAPGCWSHEHKPCHHHPGLYGSVPPRRRDIGTGVRKVDYVVMFSLSW